MAKKTGIALAAALVVAAAASFYFAFSVDGEAAKAARPGGGESAAAARQAAQASKNAARPAERIREPAVAGQFYPADPAELARDVKGFIEKGKAEVPAGTRAIGVVAPHAGYEYSGATAGKAYAWLAGAAPKRVIVLALSHGGGRVPLWIDDADAYRLPGGDIPVDRDAVEALKKAGLPAIAGAAGREHSLEVQLPFLREALKPGWRLVPIYVAGADLDTCKSAAAAIKTIMDDSTIVVASSDFTHYGASYGYVPFSGTDAEVSKKLEELDGGAVKLILAKDAAGLDEYLDKTGATVCGRYPITVLLDLAPEWASGREAGYAQSGAISKDYSLSVGYAGIVFTVSGRDKDFWGAQAQGEKAMGEPKQLTDGEKKALLKLARETLGWYVVNGGKGKRPEIQLTDTLKEKRGAFVTLTEGGRLRGCIGYVEAIKPLWETVMENTVNAAVEDPRFPQVQASEVKSISIEISAMSPLRKITDVSEIQVGKHGIMLTRGYRRGLLLPQVATEYGWERDEFLMQTCVKAGLPRDAWKDPATTIEIFSAEVFHEEEPK